jgi:hypothetical protein
MTIEQPAQTAFSSGSALIALRHNLALANGAELKLDWNVIA